MIYVKKKSCGYYDAYFVINFNYKKNLLIVLFFFFFKSNFISMKSYNHNFLKKYLASDNLDFA